MFNRKLTRIWAQSGTMLMLCFVVPSLEAAITCKDFTEQFKQQDFTKIESMFKRAVQELGYPESSIYLNQLYAKSASEQIKEIRRVYRGCYALKKENELLVNLI
ncbi:hypothetical protein [Vibrio renipiscarius]|nr:hypothetical protein [Vibrio renipiscarius]